MSMKQCLRLSVILSLSLSARADTGTDTDLKTIMQGIRNDTVMVFDGLLIDDYDVVAGAAARIADHPEIPPEQVTLIAAELGTEMAAFKQFDTLVHDLSLAIQSAALENDRSRAITAYQQMTGACLACHASFRRRLTAALNPANESE